MSDRNPYRAPATTDAQALEDRRAARPKERLSKRLARLGGLFGFFVPAVSGAYFLFRPPTAADLELHAGTGSSGVIAVFLLFLSPIIAIALAGFGYMIGNDVERNGRW